MLLFLSLGFPQGAGMVAFDPLVLLAAVFWAPGECQVCAVPVFTAGRWQERGREGSSPSMGEVTAGNVRART